MPKRNIPIYFDNVVIMSPAEPIGESSNLNRLKVGVFTKYGNRNGSYITDAIAERLIESASHGDTPVVGFFDGESKGWSGHTGPTLANGYGYVEYFDGWYPFQDTDGVTRDYAVFSVVLFTKYFDAANYVIGQNQSMELDINSIEGDWADIDGVEYFVYTKADIMGLCIIGNHEPCFSVSSFFSKKNEEYGTQYEKFSSLLADVKSQVEEAEKNLKGGEHPMDNNNLQNPEVNEPTPAPDFEQNQTEQEPTAPVEPAAENAAEPAAEPATAAELAAEPAEPAPAEPAETEPEPAAPANDPEPAAANAEFEAQIAELQNQLTEMTTNYENAQTRIAELEAQITSASETETALREQIATYEAERSRVENEQRNALVERYQNELDEESLADIREHLNEYSLSELESKLAILYANKHMAGSAKDVVPLPEPVVDEFALFMQKYRKH